MLHHIGPRRTYNHNIRLAALLGLTAGFVNVVGLLGFLVLTTNVTGHVAVFAQKITEGDWSSARMVALWMICFFLGAFSSSFLIRRIGRDKRFAFAIPILVEIFILISVAYCSHFFKNGLYKTEVLAGCLLFAMGLQNAMVSMISGSVVRTTHLTGMFTDLGIELSEIIQIADADTKNIKQKINLRLVIIFFFVSGGIIGGYLYRIFFLYSLFVPALILFMALFYDIFRVKVIYLTRKIKRNALKNNRPDTN